MMRLRDHPSAVAFRADGLVSTDPLTMYSPCNVSSLLRKYIYSTRTSLPMLRSSNDMILCSILSEKPNAYTLPLFRPYPGVAILTSAVSKSLFREIMTPSAK